MHVSRCSCARAYSSVGTATSLLAVEPACLELRGDFSDTERSGCFTGYLPIGYRRQHIVSFIILGCVVLLGRWFVRRQRLAIPARPLERLKGDEIARALVYFAVFL